MRSRVFLKLMAAFLAVIAVSTVTVDYAISRFWEASLRDDIEHNLLQKTQLLAGRLAFDKQTPVVEIGREAGAAAGARVTVIEADGKVLADTNADPALMENHRTRPEFMQALAGRPGASTRFSHTLGVDMLYVAVPVPGGAVRMAYPLSSIRASIAQFRRTLWRASLLAFAFAAVLAGFATRSISARLLRIVTFARRVAAGEYTARVGVSGGDEIAVVATALENTARQVQGSVGQLERQRKEFETLLNSIEDAVLAVSPARKVQWANRSMNRLLRNSVRVGAPLAETIRDPDLAAAVQQSLVDRASRSVRAAAVVPARTFDATVAPMPDGGAVVVLHDLTEVERVEKTRRNFIANVSHELRTPLTSIQGYAETLLETAAPGARQTEFLEIIRKNSARMARLTEDLLTLARVESGEQKLEPRDVSCRQLLDDAVEAFREAAREHDLELIVEEAPDVEVRADPDAMHQVFTNLIDNAFKYAAAGKRIVLGARQTGGGVEFYVRDFGPGIASDHLPRLFERFYRVDTARSRQAGGTGLGLAIVKHIVINHGGSVRAGSALNHGSTFFFTLPLAARAPSTPV